MDPKTASSEPEVDFVARSIIGVRMAVSRQATTQVAKEVDGNPNFISLPYSLFWSIVGNISEEYEDFISHVNAAAVNDSDSTTFSVIDVVRYEDDCLYARVAFYKNGSIRTFSYPISERLGLLCRAATVCYTSATPIYPSQSRFGNATLRVTQRLYPKVFLRIMRERGAPFQHGTTLNDTCRIGFNRVPVDFFACGFQGTLPSQIDRILIAELTINGRIGECITVGTDGALSLTQHVVETPGGDYCNPTGVCFVIENSTLIFLVRRYHGLDFGYGYGEYARLGQELAASAQRQACAIYGINEPMCLNASDYPNPVFDSNGAMLAYLLVCYHHCIAFRAEPRGSDHDEIELPTFTEFYSNRAVFNKVSVPMVRLRSMPVSDQALYESLKLSSRSDVATNETSFRHNPYI
uniref:Uncharacterized protein n=2 Tax=Leptomonas pyrrhocoris ostravirus TaxID=3070843 RepID=A0AA50KHG4_9VIRU|nr:hypothetical protein [Leptomonas pyrrhocoris ostravirus]